MRHTRKNSSKDQVEIAVVMEPSEIKAAHGRAIEKLGKDVKVAGFRAGKAPANIMAMHIDQNKLTDEVVNDAVNKALVDILVAEQIQPLDKPNVNITKLVPFEVLEFTIIIPVIPPVKLGDYMNLRVKKGKAESKPADIDATIEQLRSNLAEKKSVKRAAEVGDEVVLDFTGMRDGKEFDGGSAKDFPLAIGSKSFIPGFEDGIIGHKAGDKFDMPVTFPKDYHVKALAGAETIFKVKLHKVNQVVRSEVDDKFAAKASNGQIKSVKDLRADIKRELNARAEYEANEKFKGALLYELVKKSTVEAPEILIDDQAKALENDFRQNLAYRGMSEKQYFESNGFKDHDDWAKKELQPQAEARVKNGLVLAELAKTEKIEVSDDEIDERQKRIVEQYNDPKLVDRFKSPEMRRQIGNDLAIEKALNKLVAYNE
jgi:trigger factor